MEKARCLFVADASRVGRSRTVTTKHFAPLDFFSRVALPEAWVAADRTSGVLRKTNRRYAHYGSSTERVKQVVVIGGGPAGMRAAEVASEAGAKTLLCDGQSSFGRKFLIAG